MAVPEHLQPFTFPALVTVAYIALYYAYIVVHLRVKAQVQRETKRLFDAQKKDENSSDDPSKSLVRTERKKLPVNVHPRNIAAVANHPAFIRAERTVLNMLEQMPPFLFGLWLFSVFVDPTYGGYLGVAYIASRSLYYSFYTKVPLLLGLVTFPNYGVILWFYVRTAIQILS